MICVGKIASYYCIVLALLFKLRLQKFPNSTITQRLIPSMYNYGLSLWPHLDLALISVLVLKRRIDSESWITYNIVKCRLYHCQSIFVLKLKVVSSLRYSAPIATPLAPDNVPKPMSSISRPKIARPRLQDNFAPGSAAPWVGNRLRLQVWISSPAFSFWSSFLFWHPLLVEWHTANIYLRPKVRIILRQDESDLLPLTKESLQARALCCKSTEKI